MTGMHDLRSADSTDCQPELLEPGDRLNVAGVPVTVEAVHRTDESFKTLTVECRTSAGACTFHLVHTGS